MPDVVRAAVYGATAIKITGPVQYGDVSALSRDMYCSADFILHRSAILKGENRCARRAGDKLGGNYQ